MKLRYKLIGPIVIVLLTMFLLLYYSLIGEIDNLAFSERRNNIVGHFQHNKVIFTDEVLRMEPQADPIPKFDELREMDPSIFKIKIWGPDLKIVYSDSMDLIGTEADAHLNEVRNAFTGEYKINFLRVGKKDLSPSERGYGPYILGIFPLQDSSGRILLVAEIFSSSGLNDIILSNSLKDITWLLVIALFVLIMIEYLLLNYYLFRPIKILNKEAAAIGAGNFNETVTIRSNDEFGDLAQAFTAAAQNIAAKTRALEDANKELNEGKDAMLNLVEDAQISRDILDVRVKERTAELEYERAKLSEIAELMPTGAVLLDVKGNVSFVNTAAVNLLHLSDKNKAIDILAKTFETIPLKEHVAKALSGTSVDVPEIESLGKIFSLSFNFLKSDGGSFGELIWIQDITTQKLLERSKNQFVAIASHEMRTPLTIIRGNAELLLEDKIIKDSADMKDGIDSIHRSSVRLLNIVNDFLDVQNLEDKRIALKTEKTDIFALLSETVNDISKLASAKGISLTFKMPSFKVPEIEIDKYRLQQIFVNLLSNAVHYTDNGEVTVSAEKKDDSVKILFEDTGVGIDPEDQRRLFKKIEVGKRFVQSKEFGSGLGLYISRLLADLMKIKVELEKSEPGVGSVFSVTVPLSPGSNAAVV